MTSRASCRSGSAQTRKPRVPASLKVSPQMCARVNLLPSRENTVALRLSWPSGSVVQCPAIGELQCPRRPWTFRGHLRPGSGVVQSFQQSRASSGGAISGPAQRNARRARRPGRVACRHSTANRPSSRMSVSNPDSGILDGRHRVVTRGVQRSRRRGAICLPLERCRHHARTVRRSQRVGRQGKRRMFDAMAAPPAPAYGRLPRRCRKPVEHTATPGPNGPGAGPVCRLRSGEGTLTGR